MGLRRAGQLPSTCPVLCVNSLATAQADERLVQVGATIGEVILDAQALPHRCSRPGNTYRWRKFVLGVDASNYSMGCVLQQLQDCGLKVTGYVSKSFKDAELRYSTKCRELAAVIYRLKYYHHFLLGFPYVC